MPCLEQIKYKSQECGRKQAGRHATQAQCSQEFTRAEKPQWASSCSSSPSVPRSPLRLSNLQQSPRSSIVQYNIARETGKVFGCARGEEGCNTSVAVAIRGRWPKHVEAHRGFYLEKPRWASTCCQRTFTLLYYDRPLPPPSKPALVHPGEDERVHQCRECGLILSTRSALTAHTRSHRAAADAHRCDVCHKTFAVPARLVRHYRTHTGERPFECEYCHKMFSVKENLQVHRRIHTKERPYRCGVCGAAFEHSGKLHRHARIHTGERPHACPHCHKTFIQSGQLVIHLRTHTGEKPYRCPAPGCGKGFTCSKQLKVHSRTHTGERPYTCEICLRDFGYNHVLKLHRFQHFGERCYRCTVCDGTFNTKKQMEAHIYKEHGADSQGSLAPLPTPAVNGNMMCDIVEAALQQLPPTPPSSPPSPQTPVPAAKVFATTNDIKPSVSSTPLSPTRSPSPPPFDYQQYTLAPSSLPPRKRKFIPHIEDISAPVRHTSVIQFAPAAAETS